MPIVSSQPIVTSLRYSGYKVGFHLINHGCFFVLPQTTRKETIESMYHAFLSFSVDGYSDILGTRPWGWLASDEGAVCSSLPTGYPMIQ